MDLRFDKIVSYRERSIVSTENFFVKSEEDKATKLEFIANSYLSFIELNPADIASRLSINRLSFSN